MIDTLTDVAEIRLGVWKNPSQASQVLAIHVSVYASAL